MTNKFTLNKNEEKRFELHQSDINVWQRCRLKAFFSSRHALDLSPKREQTNLYFGSGLHKALEYYYSHDVDPVKIWNYWVEFEKEWISENSRMYGGDDDSIEKDAELGRGMLDYYKKYDPDKKLYWKNNEWEVIDTEVSFKVPIPTHNGNKSQCDYVGRADGVLEDKYGRLWALENKGWSNPSTDHLDMDRQADLYTWGLTKEYGKKFEGILYNVLAKAVPEKPSINKNGSVSRRWKKNLTRKLYEEAIEEQDEHKKDYKDILEKIDREGREFVKRKPIRRNDKELDRIEHDLYTIYKDMHGSEIYPNPMKRFGKMCGDCDYRGPCKLIMEGRNPEKMLDRKFESANINKEEQFEEYLESKLDGDTKSG